MCDCNLGLSARAIKHSGHTDHPHDPSDLLRCVNYCRQQGISVETLRKRMAGRSPQWDALVPEWEWLAGLLRYEMAASKNGRVPLTYAAMRAVLDGAR